jgi:hypothetical protein
LISDPLSVSRGAGLVLIGGDVATGAMRREQLDHRRPTSWETPLA